MKKILLAAAMLVFAVSCNWDKGKEPKPLSVKRVDRLVMGDGNDVAFDYDADGYVSTVSYAAGKSISLEYEGFGTGFPVVTVNDGTSGQIIKLNGGYIRSVWSEDNVQISDLEYNVNYGYLQSVRNNADNAQSTINWNGGYILLPASQVSNWSDSDGNILTGPVLRKDIIYVYGNSSPFNFLCNINLLPFIAEEYTEVTGIDKAVVAGLGAMRTYYLPVAVDVTTTDYKAGTEDDSDLDATGNSVQTVRRLYTYDCDNDGYINAVYVSDGTENAESELLFEVVYATAAGTPEE